MVNQSNKHFDFVPVVKKLRACIQADSKVYLDWNGYAQAYCAGKLGTTDWITWLYPLAHRTDKTRPAHEVLDEDTLRDLDVAAPVEIVLVAEETPVVHQYCSFWTWLRGGRLWVFRRTSWIEGRHGTWKLSQNLRLQARIGQRIHGAKATRRVAAYRRADPQQAFQIPRWLQLQRYEPKQPWSRISGQGKQSDYDELKLIELDIAIHLQVTLSR